ncbi:uncharacterized protein K444DRAFT_643110 [Hyaloscypha bicolor E]|uniref:3beta-hydroxysteroid 3-dehydrogenase n=1 Tax=Hyaloscypha bicolor E TaxID=1095630 RepID=A0A2J6TAY8_9HELO|nr:uncharacterized protein K444DRAFT_643110 [Hyaloscypha bicolor E]PMD60128.1 hypothetical protein K444DRAFT_643110 [Hyaloscypha bicolor E]
MSAFTHPKLRPLPAGINLTERVALVTGASSDLGLETARQHLVLKISTVILAVRNPSKAEACISELAADPSVKKNNAKAIIKVMKVDMEDPHSMVEFANAVVAEIPVVDYLILAALLPGLEASAGNTGRASRISWVGSRRHESPTWASEKHVKKDESILNHMDDPKNFGFTTECGDTRTLCHCIVQAIKDRSVKEGAWVLSHAASVVDSSSNGRFLTNKDDNATSELLS